MNKFIFTLLFSVCMLSFVAGCSTQSSTSNSSHEEAASDVKQIYLEPTYSMIDYFHILTHDETFDIVKAFVEVTNNSDKTVHFSPVAILTSNTGQKWTWDQDIYLDDLSGTIEPKQTKKGNIGYIVNNNHPSPTKYVLQTSDVFDKKQIKMADSTKISLTLPD